MQRRALLTALFSLSALTVGTGVYFMALRPPLLPEDLRFVGFEPGQAPDALLRWLSIVFRTWGGFMIGFGFCLGVLASRILTKRDAWLRLGAALGVFVAFGSFLVSNIQLRSDFLWYIALLFAIAIASAALLVGRPSPMRFGAKAHAAARRT